MQGNVVNATRPGTATPLRGVQAQWYMERSQRSQFCYNKGIIEIKENYNIKRLGSWMVFGHFQRALKPNSTIFHSKTDRFELKIVEHMRDPEPISVRGCELFLFPLPPEPPLSGRLRRALSLTTRALLRRPGLRRKNVCGSAIKKVYVEVSPCTTARDHPVVRPQYPVQTIIVTFFLHFDRKFDKKCEFLSTKNWSKIRPFFEKKIVFFQIFFQHFSDFFSHFFAQKIIPKCVFTIEI